MIKIFEDLRELLNIPEEPKSGIADGIKIEDNVEISLFGPNGEEKDHRSLHNTVTTAGKNGVIECLLAAPSSPGKPTHMAVGTGSPAATLLGTETDRNALTSKTRSGAVLTMVGDWAAGDATGALTEAGVFDVVTANTVNMYLSASFSVVNKGAADTLSISWTLTAS